MTEEEILQGNKLIADFMEIKSYSAMGWYGLDKSVYEFKEPRSYFEGRTFLEDYLRYHSYWDWLMPVIQKISDLEYNFTAFQEEEMERKKDEVILMPMYFKIDRAFARVIEFIKWYNTKNNPHG